MSRRFALIAALCAALLLPGTASAAVTFTLTDNHVSPTSATFQYGTNVVWQSTNTNNTHTVTADKFGLFSFPMPSHTTNSVNYTFERAGSFGFHCQIHGSMRGTVNVGMTVNNSTPAVGQMITITFASTGAPSGMYEQVQKRKVGGTWKTISTNNIGTTVTWTPPKAKTFQFRARLIQTAGNVMSNWSPLLVVAAH